MRLKKGKKRFEIACYKNKVLDWRNGNEKNIDEVVQIQNVFINVSKGETAKKDDLVKAFGKDVKQQDIILEILNKGELQVGEKERQAELERIKNEVVSIVASKLINPNSKMPYSTQMIEKALNALTTQGSQENKERLEKGEGHKEGETRLPTWTGVKENKDAKAQALLAMKALIARQPMPVQRARMRLRIVCPVKESKHIVKIQHEGDAPQEKVMIKDKVLSWVEQVDRQDVEGSDWIVEGLVEPGNLNLMEDFFKSHTKGLGRVDVLEQMVAHED